MGIHLFVVFGVTCGGSKLLFYFILSSFYLCDLLLPVVTLVMMKTSNIGLYYVSSIPYYFLLPDTSWPLPPFQVVPSPHPNQTPGTIEPPL